MQQIEIYKSNEMSINIEDIPDLYKPGKTFSFA